MLGFASEFKIREFERQGLLRSVRGAMRTAFYPRPDILALKAHLAQTQGASSDEWTDADLITLLEHPSEAGRPRTALELVTLARITIERAERVYAFWAESAAAALAPHPPSEARRPLPPQQGEAGSGAPQLPNSSRPTFPALRGVAGSGERRGEERLARDGLIRELRDPDPRVRQEAFERLRESRNSAGG